MSEQNNYDFWGAPPEAESFSTIGIFVFAESENSGITEGALGALGKARELADALGTGVGAVLFTSTDENLANSLVHAGADTVYLPGDKNLQNYDTELYCKTLFNLIQQIKTEIVLAELTPETRDFFPRLAQRIPTGLVSGCTHLEIDTMERKLLATRPIYGGKMFEVITWQRSELQMALLQPGIFPLPIMDELRSGQIEKV